MPEWPIISMSGCTLARPHFVPTPYTGLGNCAQTGVFFYQRHLAALPPH